jgi:hypothetical protein
MTQVPPSWDPDKLEQAWLRYGDAAGLTRKGRRQAARKWWITTWLGPIIGVVGIATGIVIKLLS